MAKVHYPFVFSDRLLSSRFDSLSRLKRVKIPVLVIHSDRETIVPIRLRPAAF